MLFIEINMDPNPDELYKRQLEYEEYIRTQKNNNVDLTKLVDPDINPNDSIKALAEFIFNKNENNLKDNLTGILLEGGHDTVDVFCMLLELFLYGYDVLVDSQYDIFDLVTSTDDLVFSIRSYLKSTGFDMKMDEVFDEDININLYRDRDDYYCKIGSMPPDFLGKVIDPWDVLDYRLITNRKFIYDTKTSLSTYKAYFINKQKRIFIVSFDFAK